MPASEPSGQAETPTPGSSPGSPGTALVPPVPTLPTVRHWFTAPEYRRLRWILWISGATQFLLAPWTSWGSDTTSFVLNEVSLVYTGSLYGSGSFANPPLGPVLALPFYAGLARTMSAQSFVQTVPAMAGISPISGFVDAVVPTPTSLFFLKLPLICAGLLAGALLYSVVFQMSGRRRAADWAVAGWLLNPLVIWATAVHAEYDVLAAVALIGFFFFALREEWVAAGLALGLGCAGKLYPILIAPVGLAYLIGRGGPGWRAVVSRPVGGFLAGVALGILPFIDLFPAYLRIASTALQRTYTGGLSVAVLTNGTLPGFLLTSGPVTSAFEDAAEWFFLVAMVAGSLIVGWAARRAPDRSHLLSTWVPAVTVWCVAGAVMYQAAPAPENLVGFVAVLLVAGPALSRFARWAVVLASGSAFALYLAFASPAAYFYPLAAAAGPAWISSINGMVTAYFHNLYYPSRALWVAFGFVGGAVLLATWLICGLGLLLRLRSGTWRPW